MTTRKSGNSPVNSTSVPTPSSSVLLISQDNTVLLLHRVKKSQNFPSAHVFPGGNLDPFHDGGIPELQSQGYHADGESYRLGAIRETFEESGILLAKNNGFGRLVEIEEKERLQGRKQVHERKIEFRSWLAGKGGRPDTASLVPFTRWVTPAFSTTAKRFTTQMYVYFLPLPGSTTESAMEPSTPSTSSVPFQGATLVPNPTDDGGIEHTSAQFLPASTWIDKARSGEIILFPPQFFLLSLIAHYMPAPADSSKPWSLDNLKSQRQQLKDSIRQGSWGEKVICPMRVADAPDGRRILSLHDPGESKLKEQGVKGDEERIVLARFNKEGPREVEVRWRTDLERKMGRSLRESKI